jgi:diadenosine tetraphosphate (Ap4A) HIT family hydrolase
MTRVAGCQLCDAAGGHVVFRADKFRLVRCEEDAALPAFYRIVWEEHVAEFSDLAAADRSLCIEAVTQVEKVLRAHLNPKKINLASLGNAVPHLHWHVIARFDWDNRYPAPVWSPPTRDVQPARIAAIEALRPTLEQALADALAGSGNCTAS